MLTSLSLKNFTVFHKADFNFGRNLNVVVIDTRCFGLHVQQDGSVTVNQGPTIDDIGNITALDEELQQSDRYLDSEIERELDGDQ